MTRTSNKKIFIASAIIGFCALFIGMLGIQASAAEKENRVLFKVVSGTATELGTDKVTNLNSSYLEEWEANAENISALSKTKNYLTEAYNRDKLPTELEEVTYESLMELAKVLTPKAEKIYQGYASLNIKDAPEGYTYAVTVSGNTIRGYYVGLKNSKIYELNISFETTTLQSLKGKQTSTSYSTNQNENSSSDSSVSSSYTEEAGDNTSSEKSEKPSSGSSSSSSGNSGSSSSGGGNTPLTPGIPNNPGTGSPDNVGGGNTPLTPGTPNNPGTGSPDNVGGGNTPLTPGTPNNPGTGSPDNVGGGN